MEYVARVTREASRTLVEFPDCPGCQTFAERGEDVGQVAREALETWLEAQLTHGDAPPTPRLRRGGKQMLRVRIAPALAVRLQLRWERLRAGYSQAELARRVGVSRQQISLLESPDANVTISTLERVANALGLELEIELLARPAA